MCQFNMITSNALEILNNPFLIIKPFSQYQRHVSQAKLALGQTAAIDGHTLDSNVYMYTYMFIICIMKA